MGTTVPNTPASADPAINTAPVIAHNHDFRSIRDSISTSSRDLAQNGHSLCALIKTRAKRTQPLRSLPKPARNGLQTDAAFALYQNPRKTDAAFALYQNPRKTDAAFALYQNPRKTDTAFALYQNPRKTDAAFALYQNPRKTDTAFALYQNPCKTDAAFAPSQKKRAKRRLPLRSLDTPGRSCGGRPRPSLPPSYLGYPRRPVLQIRSRLGGARAGEARGLPRRLSSPHGLIHLRSSCGASR